jgi:hypothetical protein
MTKSSSLGKARREVRCGASVERRNAADGLLFVTRRAGLLRPLTALTRACGGTAPPRATRLVSKHNRTGQMILHWVDTLSPLSLGVRLNPIDGAKTLCHKWLIVQEIGENRTRKRD